MTGRCASDAWQVGDIARCVDTGVLPVRGRAVPARGGQFLELGRDYRVQSVITWRPALGTMLDVGVDGGPKLARRFRRVAAEEPELFGVEVCDG